MDVKVEQVGEVCNTLIKVDQWIGREVNRVGTSREGVVQFFRQSTPEEAIQTQMEHF